jgi:hypothetical protein
MILSSVLRLMLRFLRFSLRTDTAFWIQRRVSFYASTCARNEDGIALKKKIVRRGLHCPPRSCWGEPAEPGLTLAPFARPSISARVRWVFAVSRESSR